MDRRVGGAALLVLALALVVVVSAVRGATVGGRATAEPVRPTAQVGDCVAGRIPTSVLAAEALPLPSAPVVPCSSLHAAEVVAIFPDPAAADGVPDLPRDTDVAQRCWDSAGTYLGHPRGFDVQEWIPAIAYGAAFVGPDLRQRAAGQRWAACVVFAVEPVGGASRPLVGSVADAFARPRPNTPEFAVCQERAGGGAFACSRPHVVEVFATSLRAASEVSAEAVRRTCQELVADATGMPDPTAGGRLTVATTTDDAGPAEYVFTQCVVTVTDPARRLTSTVRHLGTDPLPLTP
jgi:hypothetical protein